MQSYTTTHYTHACKYTHADTHIGYTHERRVRDNSLQIIPCRLIIMHQTAIMGLLRVSRLWHVNNACVCICDITSTACIRSEKIETYVCGLSQAVIIIIIIIITYLTQPLRKWLAVPYTCSLVLHRGPVQSRRSWTSHTLSKKNRW